MRIVKQKNKGLRDLVIVKTNEGFLTFEVMAILKDSVTLILRKGRWEGGLLMHGVSKKVLSLKENEAWDEMKQRPVKLKKKDD